MLIADILPEFEEHLELRAMYYPESEWVIAERRDVAGATQGLGRPYGINIGSTLLLDFDGAGYFEAAEIIGKRSRFEEYDVVIPQSYQKAALRLSSIPDDPRALDDESPVTVYANGARTLILAVLPKFGERSSWFALGQTVYVAVDDGRLSAMLFVLDT